MRRTGIVVLFFLFAVLSSAQSLTSIDGTVADPSKATIPGVTVELENTGNGSKRSATSDAQGRYAIQQLTPGTYNLTASAAGFSKKVISGVVLQVNTPATVNVDLEVGSVSETVAVSGEAEQVNTTDASLGAAIGTVPITQLPFEARNVALLLALQPGVTYFGENNPISGSVNGGKTDQANIILDGVDVNDQNTGRAFQSVLRVTLDSTQEFRTTTQNATADQGRSSGAQVSLVTKSGTNELHGSAYEYHRNTLTSANSFLNNMDGVERTKLIRNVFGVSVGGPIIKNRLFFFGNYEGRRDASEANVVRTVPTASFRAGTVTYLQKGGGIGQATPADLKSVDPLGLGVNPAVLAVLNQYPLPNDSSVGDGFNTAGFRFKAGVPLTWNTYIAKLDYQVDRSGKNTLSLRGNLQNDDYVDSTNLNSLAQFPGQAAASRALDNNKGLAASWISVIHPDLVSTFHYGFTRASGETTGAQTASQVTFRGIDPLTPQTRGLSRTVPLNQFSEDMALTKGAHDIRFGGVARIINNKSVSYQTAFSDSQVTYSYIAGTGRSFLLPDVASSFSSAYRTAATDLLGIVSFEDTTFRFNRDGSALPDGAPVRRNFADKEYELYAMDSWRVRPGLTVTYGLRYSISPPIHEVNGNQVSPTVNLGDWFTYRGDLGGAGLPQSLAGPLSFVLSDSKGGSPLYNMQKKNFAPRFAFAYSPQGDSGWKHKLFGGPGKTSIRAGFGMFYDLFGQSIARSFDSAAPGLTTDIQSGAGVYGTSELPRFTSVNNVPTSFFIPTPPTGGFPYTPPDGGFAIANSIDSGIKQPYTMNLNFTIGRELPKNWFVQGSYVGRLSRRSIANEDLAQTTNLRDPQSGITYYSAVNDLVLKARSNGGNGVNVNTIAPNPFWENQFPGLAGGGLTATQAAYNVFSQYPQDITSGLQVVDQFCDPSCSKHGPYSMFNSQYAALFGFRSVGKGDYHAMQWTAKKQFSEGSLFTFNYTFSKSIDLTSAAENQAAFDNPNLGSSGIILNSYNTALNRAVSDYDIRHQFTSFGVYQIPVGNGRKFLSNSNGVVNAILGGWQLGGIWTQTSGLPRSVNNSGVWPTNWNFSGFAQQVTPLATSSGSTKNATGISGDSGPNIFGDPKIAYSSFDNALAGQIGSRNVVRGDGYFSIDMNLNKRFIMPFNEHHSLQFRWEVFNITNTVRFNVATASLNYNSNGSFGKYIDLLNQPRVMQFGLRYEF